MDLHPSGLPALVGPADLSPSPPPSPSPSQPFLPLHHTPPSPPSSSPSLRFLPNNIATEIPHSDHESLLIARTVSHPLRLKSSASPPLPSSPPPFPSLHLSHPIKPDYSQGLLPPAASIALSPNNDLFSLGPLHPQKSDRVHALPVADLRAIPPQNQTKPDGQDALP